MTASKRIEPSWRRWTGRPIRAGLVLVASLAIAGATYAWSGSQSRPPASNVSNPVPPPGVPQALPGNPEGGHTDTGDRQTVDQRIGFWTKRITEQPSDFLSLIQLGLTYAEKGRLGADLDSYQRASAAVAKALALSPAYPPAIKARGAIRFALHDFSGAEADARAVLANTSNDPDGLAGLADALLEEGKLDEGRQVLDQLTNASDGSAIDIRLARLAYLTGDRSAAVADAQRAVNNSESEDPIGRGFYEYALGEYARLDGQVELARHAYQAALELRATDLGALVGLARVNAASGNIPDAVAGLRKAAAIAPQPETLALLGDLLAASGDESDAAAATDAYATVRAIRQLSETAGSVYDRSLLMFELDHGGATADILAAARASAEARPDAAGHDLVAWADYRLGQYAEARSEISAAMSSGIRDARMLFHAGAIDIATGAVNDGRTLLRQALGLGPALGPRDTAEARQLLGE